MKRITSFLATLLIAVVAMAQSETTFTVSSQDGGTYKNSSGSSVTQGWCASWTSTSENYPVTKISVPVNNLYVKTSDGFQMAVGQSSPSNWTLSVQGYEIKSYSFKFKSTNNNEDVTLTAGSKRMTSSYSTEQTWSVEDVNAQTASFQLSGGNYAINVTELTFTVSETSVAPSAMANGKVYRLVCAGTPTVSLGATALTDVAAVSTNSEDRSQQWYVTVSGDNYTFRNLANGQYLQGNNGTSGDWSLTGTSTNFTVTAVNDNYAIRQVSHTNGSAYMHKDGSNNIVSWETSATNSQWQSMEVAYTADELQTIWDDIDAIVVPESTVEIYNTTLEAIFADKACTQLNSTYAAKTVDQIKTDANYLALPAVLQAMILKVKGGDWSEANAVNGKEGWSHDYAKRFRVQMYEPYSIEGEVTSYLRINGHCNMDNPTGLYANAGEPIYVMVEGDIANGAELWIAHQAGFGATSYYNSNAHFQLHEGLNIIPYFNDGSTLWINYVVHTYNANGATIADKFPHKLSDYQPLKIHIEGGHINGYYNAMGDFRAADSGTEDLWGSVDNDEDWNYYKVRAPLNGTDAPNRDFPLLGHRQTLLFPLGQQENSDGGMEEGLLYHLDNITVPTAPNCYAGSGTGFGNYSDTYYPGMGLSTGNGKINIMLEAWDRIMYSELATLGVVSKSAMARMNTLYPRWTSEGTPAEIYDYNNASSLDGKTYQEFCQGIDYSEYFNHHACGVGANSGYMSGGWRVCNYHYNTMESIIGKIASEHGPTWGPAHEIGHQHQLVFNLNGQTEVTNNFFSNVAVWYMGMGTSRVNGSEGSLESVLDAFNTDGNDLYTNNIWAIAHLYYRLWLYYHLAGNNTQFWPRLFELCRREPIVNGGQISGETSLLRFYKHACDAAGEDLTEFFRAHGFFEIMENRVVGDYSNATYNVTQAQIDAAISEIKAKNYPVNYAVLLINDATSETTVKHDGSTRRALWDGSATAEYGSVNDFVDGDIAALTGYTATVDADGSVTMSGGQGGVGFLVFNEKGELVSFSNKSNFTLNEEAMYQLATGKTSIVAVNAENETLEAEIDMTPMQKSLLSALIADVEAMPIDDGTYTHIGFYTKASAGELLAALESAKEILEADNGGYAAAYEILYTQKEKLIENTDKATFVPFDPSLTYNITSYAYGNIMHLNSGVKVSSSADKSANTAKWQFKTTSTDGVYNVYCLSGYYLPAASKSALLTVVSDQSSAATYTLNATDKVGAWTISVTPAGEFTNLHDDSNGKVVGWSTDVTASMWCLTALEGSTNSNASSSTDELQALIAKTETLVEQVASVSYKGKINLQASDATSAFYITSNATEGGHEPRYLLDNNVTTFFHTVWAETSPGADHYLQIDMGENTSIDQFVFKYTNLPFSSWNVDAATTILVQGANILDEFTDIATLTSSDSNPLPTAKEGTYTSAILGAKDTNYRYIRLTVTNATGGKYDNHYYFGMSEFSLERVNNYSVVKDYYTTVRPTTVETAADKIVDAKTALTSGNGIADAKTALQDAYDALYAEYNNLANSKKNELQAVIDAITAKMNEAGTVSVVKGGELALQVTNASGDYYLSTNSQESGDNRNISKLVDGVTNNSDSYFHTNWQTSVGADHHLLLDMGTGNSLGKFKFIYTTRNNNAGIDAPRTIVVEGSYNNSSFTQIAELTGLPTGQHATYTSATLGSSETSYRYIRFRVTAGAGTVGGYAYFAMSEFDVIEETANSITINAAYSNTAVTEELLLATYNQIADAETLKNNTASTELIDAQIAKLRAAKVALETAMATKTGIDKETLQALYDEAVALYSKMTGGEFDYTPSALTPELLAEANTVIVAALDKLENATTQAEIDEAVTALQEKYDALFAIEEANVATTIDKAELNTAITNANALVTSITDKGEGYYSTVTDLGLDALNDALSAAEDAVDRYYLTEEQYTTLLGTLNTNYAATLAVVNADCADRTALTAAIADANTLVAAIAAKGEGYYSTATGLELEALNTALSAAQSGIAGYLTEEQYTTLLRALNTSYAATLAVVNADCADRTALTTAIAYAKTLIARITNEVEILTALPLQATTAENAYYIWCNNPAGDSNGVAGLIDKNDDGTANTGTFLGTNWSADVDPYTHYIEIDLGAENAIDKLSMDYTTRNSTHADQRPNAIKILGSNDKENYTPITEITEGLPTNANKKWSMAAPLELGASYRYIRIAVGSQRGFFHMSDFNLYTVVPSYVLDDYFTTAEALDYNALCLAVEEAENALAYYLTKEQCNAVCENLNNSRTAVNEIIAKDYTTDNRSALVALAAEVAPLADGVVTVVEGETPITLQATDENEPYYIYCNAPETTNTYPGDNLGVAALLDVDANGEPVTTTHLHTTYSGNDHYDDLDHYLRVDMGESNLVSFKFGYINRNGNTDNAPKVIFIEGSNDCANFEEITTLTNLPTRYQSNEITNGKAYRYIRFMVKATHSDNSHPYFAMSHFEMTACKTIAIGEGYTSPELTVDVAYKIHNALFDANNIDGHYLANEDGEALKSDLQAAKELLLSLTDKTALNDLIAATTLLKKSLYEIAVVSCTATDVALQETDEAAAGYLYCNAPETNSTWDSDNLGVIAAIDLTEGGDPDLSTFLHTEYGNDPSADGLDHYLRVDLGAEGATAYVEFGYVGRSGHLEKSPETVIVAATNDLNGEWTRIKNLTMPQPSATAETKTGALGNGVAYRYWRFMVTDTHFNGGVDGNGHPYFALSDFNVYKCTDVVLDSQLKNEYTPNIYIYATRELVTEVEGAITAAREIADATVGQPEVDAAVVALQAEYDKLAEAIENYWCPVTLTTDENNPVLYTINAIGRSNDKAWQYSLTNNNITIVDRDATNLFHLWYFVAGTEEHTVKIVPVMTPSYKLSATDFTNGINKVSAVAESSVDWVFAYEDNYYNFKPYGRNTTYLSNIYGGSRPLGFFDAADGGSYVSFTKVELENYGLARLAELSSNVYNAPVIVGTEVGSYTGGEEYNGVLTAAQEMVTAATSTNEAYATAFASLFSAHNSLELNMPLESGAEGTPVLYTITNAIRNGGKMFAGSEMEPVLCWDNNEVTAKYIFMFEPTGEEGKFYMKSLERGTYVSTALAHNAGIEKIAASKENAVVVTIANMSNSSRAVSITPVGGAMLHADASGNANKVVAWNNTSAGDASAWFIDEVTNTDELAHPTTVNSAGVGSIMLGYTATIPEGIEAFYPKAYSEKFVTLAPYDGVLPANTAAILKVKDGYDPAATYNFTYNSSAVEDDETTAPGKATAANGVVIAGSLYTTLVDVTTHDAEMGDVNFYMFLSTKNNSKLYWVYENYLADGSSTGNNDDGGYIKVNANRAYIALAKPVAQNLSSFSLRFDYEWGTTEIEDVETENTGIDTIFDLQGRKLNEITEPGFYIVNGVKVFVK